MNENTGESIHSSIKKVQHLLIQPMFWWIQLQNIVALLSWVAAIRLAVYLMQFILFSVYFEGVDTTAFGEALSLGEAVLETVVLVYAIYVSYCMAVQKAKRWQVFRRLLSLFCFNTLCIGESLTQLSTYEGLYSTADITMSFVSNSIFCITMIGLGYLNKRLLWLNIRRSINWSELAKKELSYIQKDRMFEGNKWRDWILVNSLTNKVMESTDKTSFLLGSRKISLRLRYSWLTKSYE
ncbi:hypothetical protein [Enterococcus sp. LJL90]